MSAYRDPVHPKNPGYAIWWCIFWIHDWIPLRKVGWPHLGWQYVDRCSRCGELRETMIYD